MNEEVKNDKTRLSQKGQNGVTNGSNSLDEDIDENPEDTSLKFRSQQESGVSSLESDKRKKSRKDGKPKRS